MMCTVHIALRCRKRMFKIDHIELMLFSVIDPKYITDAENSLKKFFENNIINYENKEELIVLDNITYKSTIQHYKLIKNSYIGCYMEMQNKIDELERRLKDLLFSLLRAYASKDKMNMICQKKN